MKRRFVRLLAVLLVFALFAREPAYSSVRPPEPDHPSPSLLWLENGPAEASPSEDGLTEYGLPPFYAQSGWPSAHRDARNSDYAPFVAPVANVVKWRALEGTAVLPAPAIGAQDHLYVTTGRGVGTSHLHAYDQEGKLLWESMPQHSQDDLDSLAAWSSPLIDRDGMIYIGDSNQFWAFKPDGQIQWVAELPDADAPMGSAILTKQGYVGGITVKGKVVLFRREDGLPAVPVFELPGGSGPPGTPPAPGLWTGGLLDPAIITDTLSFFLGYNFEVANTPAVHPQSGRIYIVGAGAEPDQGLFYGLDIVENETGNEIKIAFSTPMGSGSGTSPAIAPDGSQVYAADGTGIMTAFDAATGAIRWQTTETGAAASPSIGPDGVVYTGGGRLSALDPVDGSVRWRVDFDQLAASMLPTLPPNRYTAKRQPVGRTNGVISISARHLWAVLVLGYEILIDQQGSTVVQPRTVVLAAIDPANGAVLSVTELADTNDGVISIGSDGSLHVGHAAALSSLLYYGINPSLPEWLRLPGPPQGGFTVLEPLSYHDHALEGIAWVHELNTQALSDLLQEETSMAFASVQQAHAQLANTAVTIQQALDREEIGADQAAALHAGVAQAQAYLKDAQAILSDTSLPEEEAREEAARRVALADIALPGSTFHCDVLFCIQLPLVEK